jgi:hypothetical protein
LCGYDEYVLDNVIPAPNDLREFRNFIGRKGQTTGKLGDQRGARPEVRERKKQIGKLVMTKGSEVRELKELIG